MKRLLLLGGGHAHLRVLRAIGERGGWTGWEVRLVTPRPLQIYSGMLPGWVAGHYRRDEIAIDVEGLARRAGVAFVPDAATGLDAAARTVRTAGGELAFDALSIDIGSAPPLQSVPGAATNAVAVRPLESFLAAWDRLVHAVHARCAPFHVVVLGAGPGGVELALALRHRSLREGWSHLHVHLAGAGSRPLPGAPAAAQGKVVDLLRNRCVQWHPDARATLVAPGHVAFTDGRVLPCDACWLVTGAAAPAWLAATGLSTDADGFVRVGPTLQSVSHPEVFAAGDVASHPQALPKSGVYAVRAGQVLARNLHAYCAQAPLRDWRPQRRALYLLSAGDRRALAIRGGWSWQGRWVWWWKDRIDRGFVAGYAKWTRAGEGPRLTTPPG